MIAAAELKDMRELEDMLINCLQYGLVKGKLDQRAQRLLVESTFGRDVNEGEVPNMLKKLKNWDQQLAGAQKTMETLISSHQESLHSHIAETEKTAKQIQIKKDEIAAVLLTTAK